MKYFNLKLKKGFTLVETLIAISVFSLSVVVMMSVLANGIADANYTKQKVVATYLAQEGVEFIRNMRDTYVLYHENGWEGFKQTLIEAECNSGSGCYFTDENFDYEDIDESMITLDLSGCGANCELMRQFQTNGKYSYSGVLTNFRRKINVNISENNQEVEVISTVSWEQGSGIYQITFSEDLFNWVE